MDFGGILSGIGIAADETVRAGRKNKHEREQIELRDALARDREKERESFHLIASELITWQAAV